MFNMAYALSNFNLGGAYCCIYDLNKVLVESFNTLLVTIPSNGYYIRVSGTIANKATQQIELGTTPTEYEAYTEYRDVLNLQVEQTALKTSLNKKLDKQLGKNLLNPNDGDIAIGYFLNVNGVLESNSAYSVTGYIPVVAGQTVISNFKLNGGYVYFYNAEKVKTVSGGNSDTYKTVPIGSVYVRYSAVDNGAFIGKQIELGTTPTEYEAYTEYRDVEEIKGQVQDTTVEVVLPTNLYFAKGKESCIYYENILLKNLLDPTCVYFNKGTNYTRLVKFNFSSAIVDNAMTAQIIRNFKKGKLKTFNYNVVDNSLNSGSVANVLHIGDSFTDIGSYIKEIKAQMTADGVDYNLLGTCGDTTFRAEGLSGGTLSNTFLSASAGVARIVEVTGMSILPASHHGHNYLDDNGNIWTIRGGKIDANGNGHIRVTNYAAVESDFSTFPLSGKLTKTTSDEGDSVINYTNPINAYFNPFINHDTGVLDLSNYLTFWNIDTPDIFILQFTWNDLGRWDTDTAIANLVAQHKQAVDHIHLICPSSSIILSIEPCGSVNGNQEWNGKKYAVLNFAKKMIEQFEADANYNSFIKIAPSYAFVDLVKGYSNSTVTPCSRYTNDIETSGGDGIHPSTGMLQIADCIAPIVSHFILFNSGS